MYRYKTRGVCSSMMEIELAGEQIASLNVIGGCTGNLAGIAKLVQGRNVDEVIGLLKGVRCRGNTSCPDQLATALEQIKAGQLKENGTK